MELEQNRERGVTLYNYSCLAKYVVKSLTGIVDFWFGYEHGCTCSTQYKFAPAHTLHIFGGAIKADADKKLRSCLVGFTGFVD